jgi:hypothetical protein
MSPRYIFISALCIAVLVFFNLSSAQAEDFVSPLEAKEVAQELIQRNVAYYSAHPERAVNIPEWSGATLGDPILIHTYPDLKPCYYVVPVVSPNNEIISLIGTSAKTREWRWFNRVQLEKFPKVSQNQALQICQLRIQNAEISEPKIVEMPNKKFYWFCLVNDHDLKEIFINIDNALEVHTNQDPDISDLTTEREPIQVHAPRPEKVVESPQKISFFYPESYNIEVPFYYQDSSWYCGEAALEMVFDYWGPHISQDDIGDVANELPSSGTNYDDLRRASHFSHISTAIQNPSLQGYNERELGYSSNSQKWSFGSHYWDRYEDLKNLISNDYPILVLTYYSEAHLSGHYRVVKGYDDSLDVFIVHDPWYAPPYSGPDVHFNQVFFVDDLWTRRDRWGLFSAPWLADVTVDSLVGVDQLFTIDVDFTYTAFHPLENQFLADSVQATIYLPSGYQLADPPSATLYFDSQYSGYIGNAVWEIEAPPDSSGPDTIRVEVKGKITGWSSSYLTYHDWIGGETDAVVTTIPYICGDVNRDGLVDIADVVYLINYLFIEGPAPIPQVAGDANYDFLVNIADVVYLINYLFIVGPLPSC